MRNGERALAWIALTVFLSMGGGFLHASDVGALLEKGTQLYDQGRYDKALKVFLKVKKQDPANLLARDYINRCSERIVENQTGERLKKAARKAEAASITIEPDQAGPAWVAPARVGTTRPVGRPSGKKKSTRAAPVAPATAGGTWEGTSDAVRLRDDLIANFKNRKAEGSPVRLERRGGKTEIIAYLNRIFLPFSDQMAPDAMAALEEVARDLRAKKNQDVVLRAVDSLTPAVRHQMLDLPSRRAAILFSYYVHASLGTPPRLNPVTLTTEDFED